MLAVGVGVSKRSILNYAHSRGEEIRPCRLMATEHHSLHGLHLSTDKVPEMAIAIANREQGGGQCCGTALYTMGCTCIQIGTS